MNGPALDIHDPFDDARELINRLLDNELTSEDAKRLEQLVCERPDVRRFYILNMHLWCNLAPHMTATAGLAEDASPGSNLDFEESMVLPALSGSEEPDEPEPIELPPLVWPEPEQPNPWPRRLFGLGALAASVLLAAGLAFFLWPRTQPVVTNPLPAPAQPQPVLPEVTPEVVVPAPPPLTATLASAVGAEWAAPHASIRTGMTLPGDVLQLKKGLAEIRFASGVSMIVEAPASIRIHTDTRTALLNGKLVTTVPQAATGFVVQTAAAEVVDLGTEFGVEVDAGGATRVEVFRGKVRAEAPEPPPTTAPTANVTASAFKPREIVAGEAGRVAPGAAAVTEVPAKPLSFVRDDEFAVRRASQGGSDFHRWLAHTYELRRDPSLAAYYTFDRRPDAPGVLPNRAVSASAGAPGRFDVPLGYQGNAATAPAWVEGRWPGKDALDFSPAARHGMHLPEFPFSTNGRLTVAAWVKARSLPYWAAIAKNRGETKDTQGQFSLGVYGTDGSLVGRVTQDDNAEVLVREPATSPLPLNQWVHVALVADGVTLRLYRDGREVAAVPCTGPIARPNPKALTIGYRAGADAVPNVGNRGEHWDGLIDELAIFHRALTAREVLELYEAGRPGN